MKRSSITLAIGLALLAACSSSTTSKNDPAAPPAPPGDMVDMPPAVTCRTPETLPTGAWFTEITADSGLAAVDGNIRIVAGDVDGDGLPDLIVHNVLSARDSAAAPKKRLFLNRGNGKFEDATAGSGLLDSRDGPGTGRLANLAVLADVDNDGDLDLFSGTYIDETTTATPTSS